MPKILHRRLGPNSAVLAAVCGSLELADPRPIADPDIISIAPLSDLSDNVVLHDVHFIPELCIDAASLASLSALHLNNVQIIKPQQELARSYLILHCLDYRTVVNVAASTCKLTSGGRVSRIDNLVLDDAVTAALEQGDSDLIRSSEIPSMYVASDRLADALTAQQLRGLNIVSVEDYHSRLAKIIYAQP